VSIDIVGRYRTKGIGFGGVGWGEVNSGAKLLPVSNLLSGVILSHQHDGQWTPCARTAGPTPESALNMCAVISVLLTSLC
jgi:hypothetical protein